MPPRKRPRTCTPRAAAAAPSSSTPALLLALPADLLLEIAARSDVAAVVRCAATCKLLRREILSPAFIHSVCRRAAPPRLVGFLGGRGGFSVAHPRTPAAKSFARSHLAPFIRRSAGGTS
ncbi:unnamed protein product [Urochloa humidicola]